MAVYYKCFYKTDSSITLTNTITKKPAKACAAAGYVLKHYCTLSIFRIVCRKYLFG